MSEILVVQALQKTYVTGAERLDVLKNVDLVMQAGTTAVITGESGSGKTTLLNLMSGLDTPSSGQIYLNHKEISHLDEDELTLFRRDTIGFIFQFHYLLKDFTALENVLMPAYIAGKTDRQAQERAKKLIQDVGLEKRIQAYPSELSGGEKQRIAVARALMNEPKLIMADEPTGNLDEKNALLVKDILFELVSKYQKTLIIVTHDQTLARKTDRHLLLVHGELTEL
jgi:lipoprotein-releasing system ATP-binding protein